MYVRTRVDEPVISATKKANEMEIVMMSRVLGLRLNAILSEEQGWLRICRSCLVGCDWG